MRSMVEGHLPLRSAQGPCPSVIPPGCHLPEAGGIEPSQICGQPPAPHRQALPRNL